MKTLLFPAATLILAVGALQAAPLIYEPFDFPAGDLSTESSGAWSDSGSTLETESLTYGSLAAVGNRVTMSDDTSWTSTGSALDGFLDDGDTLWFSVVVVPHSTSTNPDFGFALGTDRGSDSNNVPLSTANGGNGLGFRFKGGLKATAWSDGSASSAAGASVSGETTYLVVGEMIFGATATDLDTINLYLPDTALNRGDAVSTQVATLNQTTFDTITFMNKAASPRDQVDEIRFGATYEDVSPVADTPPTFSLTITPNPGTPGHYDFSWTSQEGKLYDLVSSLGLDTAPSSWSVWDDRADLPSGGTMTLLEDVPGGGDPARFFAVVEKELLQEAFDTAGPEFPDGWVVAKTPETAGTTWEVGDPTGLPSLQGDDDTNCAGTNVLAGDYADEVATVTLTSPAVPIPAGGATLTFRQYIDSDITNGDVGAVRLLDASDTEIIEGVFPVTDIDGVEEGWTNESFPLPPAAAGQSVKLVFEFTTAADGTVYKGFYIDDVVVTP